MFSSVASREERQEGAWPKAATYAKAHVPTEAARRMESIGGLVAKNPARVTQIRFSQAGNDTAALLWWLEIRANAGTRSQDLTLGDKTQGTFL